MNTFSGKFRYWILLAWFVQDHLWWRGIMPSNEFTLTLWSVVAGGACSDDLTMISQTNIKYQTRQISRSLIYSEPDTRDKLYFRCKINFYDNKIKDDLNSICLVVGWCDCWRDNKNSRLHDALLHCLNECQDNDSDSTNYGTVSLCCWLFVNVWSYGETR